MLARPISFDHEKVAARMARGLPQEMVVDIPRHLLQGGDELLFRALNARGECVTTISFNTGRTFDAPCHLKNCDTYAAASPYKGLNTILFHNIAVWMTELGFSKTTVDTADFGCYVWAHFFALDYHCYNAAELTELLQEDLAAIKHHLPEPVYHDLESSIDALANDDPLALRRIIDMDQTLVYDAQNPKDLKNVRLHDLMDECGGQSISLALYLLHYRCWSGEMDIRRGSEDRTRLARKAGQYAAHNARLRIAF